MLLPPPMSLVENLQSFLTRVREQPGGLLVPTGKELEQLRMHLRARFEERRPDNPENRQWWLDAFQGRLKGLPNFAFEICTRLTTLPLRQDERLDALRTAIDSVLPLGMRSLLVAGQVSPPIWHEHLYELAQDAWHSLARREWERTETIARYAAALRLTRSSGNAIEVTPLGEILLQLRSRDALRWLLAIEVVQSSGHSDTWCMTREEAASLAEASVFLPFDDELPWPSTTIGRCISFGLLYVDEFEDAEDGRHEAQCGVTALGRELLSEVGKHETAFTLLAQALAADQTQAVLAPFSISSLETAADATVRHARMVAHEIRNALVPVRVALKQLWRDLSHDDQGGLTAELRNIIDNNVERIFRFVDESVRLTRLASEPPEIFDVLPAIRDSVGTLDRPPRRPIETTFGPGADALRVRGHRQRLVLALMNLLRNAVQAKDPDVLIEVQVSALTEQKRFRIVIDDDGPGVSAEQRTSIFQNGVSHRTDGSGHGLTLVREVIEREMSGKITCEESQRGGARFIIDLPWA